MSHELRTPLNAILGYPQLLLMEDERQLAPRARELVRQIGVSGDYLLTLINQVLDLSKIEAGRMVLNVGQCHLGTLFADVAQMLRPVADAKGLAFAVACAADAPALVRTDATKLQQVLVNLLANAVKFTDAGSVRLEVAPAAGAALRFAVVDTGSGIAEDERAALFEAFRQTASGLRSGGGTGLGLALSRKFVALLGGDLRVESAVGEGSTFAFAIRLHPDAPAGGPDPRLHRLDPPVGPVDGKDRRVLVVDDAECGRRVLTGMLRPWGFAVREAVDGEDAVAQVACSSHSVGPLFWLSPVVLPALRRPSYSLQPFFLLIFQAISQCAASPAPPLRSPPLCPPHETGTAPRVYHRLVHEQ